MASKKSLTDAAASATSKFFTGGKPDSKKGEGMQAEAGKKLSKEDKKMFSFRGDSTDVERWRMYCKLAGTKMDVLGPAAMNEYLKKHPLEGAAKEFLDQKYGK